MSDLPQMPAADENATVGGHARLTTLSVVNEAQITKKVPTFKPEKGVGNHGPFMRHVRQAFENVTGEDLEALGYGQMSGYELSDSWDNWAAKAMGPGALRDGTAVLMDPPEGATRSNYMLFDLRNRLSASNQVSRYSRAVHGESVEFKNAGDVLAMRMIRMDFLAWAERNGAIPQGMGLGHVEDFVDRTLSKPKQMTAKRLKYTAPVTFDMFKTLAPHTRDLIAEALGLDPASVIEPEKEEARSQMQAIIAEAFGMQEDAPVDPNRQVGTTLPEAMEAASVEQLGRVLEAMSNESERHIHSHYAGKLRTILVARAYMSYMESTMHRMMDVQQQRRYEQAIAERDSATVYQQKKHVPESHLDAAKASVFTKSGDFSHVEIDESVDLALMAQIEAEWKVLREALPHSDEKATLRFRKTGRHKAAGVYHPMKHNIAVDPRHPYSFVHEYFHHLDYTLGADADTRQLSLAEDFSPLLHGVQKNMRADGGIDKLDYYTTPTEVFARGAELVCYWSGLATSLNGDAAKYDTPVYRAYEPYREQLIAWYNERLGLDIAHERALAAPAAPARPALGKLGLPAPATSAPAPGERPLVVEQ